jgi:hypothetical protein
VDWIHVVQDMKPVIKLQIPSNVGNLTSSVTVSFSTSVVLIGVSLLSL